MRVVGELTLTSDQRLPVLVRELSELTSVEGTENLVVGLVREALALSGLDVRQAMVLLDERSPRAGPSLPARQAPLPCA